MQHDSDQFMLIFKHARKWRKVSSKLDFLMLIPPQNGNGPFTNKMSHIFTVFPDKTVIPHCPQTHVAIRSTVP